MLTWAIFEYSTGNQNRMRASGSKPYGKYCGVFWRLLRSQDMGYGVRRLFSITLTPPCVDPRVGVPSVKGFCNS